MSAPPLVQEPVEDPVGNQREIFLNVTLSPRYQKENKKTLSVKSFPFKRFVQFSLSSLSNDQVLEMYCQPSRASLLHDYHVE